MRTTYQLVGACAVGLLLTACGGSKDASKDSAMSADLSMANSTATAQPALSDSAAATPKPTTPAPETKKPEVKKPAPVVTKPKPAPPKPEGKIAVGTEIALHPTTNICTDSNKVGQTVQAEVATAVNGTEGVSIPAGATVNLRITALKRSENAKDAIDMGFSPTSVEFGGQTYPLIAAVTAENIEHVRAEPKSADVKKVAGGAIVGAIAGKLIGKSTKGAVVGAAAGAAAGAGAAAATANHEGCIAKGSDMTIKLAAPVTIH